jgi:aerobic-type carbon monoxide dehydrogenase small subunit (CoxS/CutS family)
VEADDDPQGVRVRVCIRLGADECILQGHADEPVVTVLRRYGRKSVLAGCSDHSCGACRILLGGALVTTCDMRFDSLSEGAHIETYEDVQDRKEPKRVLALFERDRPTRCQLCVGALGVAAEYIDRSGYSASALDESVRGASCKCTGRGSLRRALTRDE